MNSLTRTPHQQQAKIYHFQAKKCLTVQVTSIDIVETSRGWIK